MSEYFTIGERAALDRVAVPAMRAGFVADVVSAASRSIMVPPRSGARGGWRRHGRLMIGAGALVLASATAAATGWLGKLPIAIPGITRVAEQPAPKPRHVARAAKPRVAAGSKPVALAAVPVIDPTPPPPAEQWRERRQARIAAGLPVARPLMQRALAEKLRGLPPAQRKAALAEWRRIRALPPEERKAAVAKVRADYLAAHPRMAQRYEQRLERRSLAAAAGAGEALPAAPQPGSPQAAGPRAQLTPAERAERRQYRQAMRAQRRQGAVPGAGPGAAALTPEERAERRRRWQEWRAQRAVRLPQNGQ